MEKADTGASTYITLMRKFVAGLGSCGARGRGEARVRVVKCPNNFTPVMVSPNSSLPRSSRRCCPETLRPKPSIVLRKPNPESSATLGSVLPRDRTSSLRPPDSSLRAMPRPRKLASPTPGIAPVLCGPPTHLTAVGRSGPCTFALPLAMSAPPLTPRAGNTPPGSGHGHGGSPLCGGRGRDR